MFLEQEIRILEWFLKDYVTLKSNDAGNLALITGIKYILKYIQIEVKVNVLQNVTVFAVLWVK